MVDTVTPHVRSQMMASIRGKDTKPELFIRRGLHSMGFRYRLHERRLPGKPDIVFSKYRAVLFVHGCFWHRHECYLFKWPASREEFWRNKIDGNAERDRRKVEELKVAGWRVGIIWECAIKGRNRLPPEKLFHACADWLQSNKHSLEIKGQ